MVNSRQKGKRIEREMANLLKPFFPDIRRNAGTYLCLGTKRIKDNKRQEYKYEYICRCDNVIYVPKHKVNSGHTKSCGCLKKELLVSRIADMSKNNITHGMSYTRQYSIWHSMIQRCHNKNNSKYKNYGRRGIIVCKEWRNSFEKFWEDMKDGYSDNLTLDRIDFNLGYTLENCKWSTVKEQNNNKRTCRYVTHKNETNTVQEWCEKLNINPNTVRVRIHRGLSPRKALKLEQ